MDAAVRSLENSARRGTGIVDVGLPRHADYRRHAIADRTDIPVAQGLRVGLLGLDHGDAEND